MQAGWVAAFAENYGWTYQETMAVPISVRDKLIGRINEANKKASVPPAPPRKRR